MKGLIWTPYPLHVRAALQELYDLKSIDVILMLIYYYIYRMFIN